MKKNQPKGVVCGVGINDVPCARKSIAYNKWKSMLGRCYIPSVIKKHPTYKDCYVCDEWLIFSNFKKWFDDNYRDATVLDKDILVKGNRIYSPLTCCFVPVEINSLLTNRKKCRGEYPQGVRKCKWG